MPLNDLKVKGAKAGAKPYKLADERGLYLLIQPTGSKLWRFDYRHAGKRKTLAIGTYPDSPLSIARKRLGEARAQLEDGIDPSAARQAAKAAHVAKTENSFEAIAREWFGKYSPGWAKSHADKIIRRLERDVFPWMGSQPIAEIEPKELLAVLRRIEARGKLETAHRAHQNCGQVFRYAVATGRAPRDPSGDLRGALAPWKPQHYATITDAKAIGELLRAMEGHSGSLVTASALKLSPLLFVRPGELRRAEWAEIDLDKAEWRIPAEKMKARVIHIVPLPDQALSILRELHPLTGAGRYVFPSVRTRREPMSENTVNAALRRLGFRGMASTLLNEQGWNRDAIERQLAHGERDQVRAAYNYAEFMPERRKMMQAWADYLDRLRQSDSKVVALRAA
jgi:integrase